MKNTFAVPSENGILCPHFGHCQQFAIIDVENGAITDEKYVTPPPHEHGVLPGWLAEQGVTNIIAGGIGKGAIDLLANLNITVDAGAKLKSPKELVGDWLNHTLATGINACANKVHHDCANHHKA